MSRSFCARHGGSRLTLVGGEITTCRRTRVAIATVVVLAAAGLGRPAPSQADFNQIQVENNRQGTTAWELPGDSATGLAASSPNIQGYPTAISVQPGDTLQLHVSTTPAAPYRVEIYRLGWYHGLGGRLIACLPSCGASESGISQPVPSPDPNTGYLTAGWPVTDATTVGSDWVTGYYVAKLDLRGGPDEGQASWVPFIVRDPQGTSTPILVQASVNTWEAYTNWGGKSLYAFNSSGGVVPASKTVAAAMVSFERPLGTDGNAGPYLWELNLVRYLEREGFDVSYQTDVDSDQNPGSLLGHHLDVVSGHDEYWSPIMRDAYDAARDAGVNLAFVGADIGNWQMRYAGPSDQTMVEYRSASLDPDPDPRRKTVRFASPPVNRPECELLGIEYLKGEARIGDPPRSYSVTAAATSNPWFSGTGLSAGDTIYDSVGYEWDSVQSGCAVAPLQDLLTFPGLPGERTPRPADAVTYTAPSGAVVFSDGSLQLAWALDDFGHPPHADPAVQHLFANLLTSLGGPPGTGPPAPLLGGGPTPSSNMPSPGSATAPELLQPGAGSDVRSPVRFRWTSPIGDQTYQLVVDGRADDAVDASSCGDGICAANLRVPDGHHTWDVRAATSQGASVSNPAVTFLVDTAAPRPFALRSPRPRGVLWSPKPRLKWSASHDSEDGLAGYEIFVDHRRLGRTSATSYTPAQYLADGRHLWKVVVRDRVGNQRATTAQSFVVRSVRLLARTRADSLAHGFYLAVFCVQRCVITAGLRKGRTGPATHVVRRAKSAGLVSVPVSLSAAVRRRLGAPGSNRLRFTVATRIGHSVRTVVLVTRV